MSELKEIVARARAMRAENQPFLLATLVAMSGSSYRRPGARFVVSGEGVAAGSVSGGCLERDLARRGWWHTDDGRPALVTYDSASDDGELGARVGLGCNGIVDILVERVAPGDAPNALDFIEGCLARQVEGIVVTVFRSLSATLPVGAWVGVAADRPAVGPALALTDLALAKQAHADPGARAMTVSVDDATVEVLVEPVRPPPHLFVMGSGPDALPVATFARALGWTVSVWDPSSRFESRLRFAAADARLTGPAALVAPVVASAHCPVAVVMTHDFERDREALAMLLPSRARYLGVLGPRRRTTRLLAELAPNAIERLYAPAGLSVGAETPAEIALSIVAEIQSVLSGSSAVGHLRERAEAIHARPAETAKAPAPIRMTG